jgi:superfamily II DNA or RNA helicase
MFSSVDLLKFITTDIVFQAVDYIDKNRIISFLKDANQSKNNDVFVGKVKNSQGQLNTATLTFSSNDNEPVQINCDCKEPYPHNFCPHGVALFLAWEKEYKNRDSKSLFSSGDYLEHFEKEKHNDKLRRSRQSQDRLLVYIFGTNQKIHHGKVGNLFAVPYKGRRLKSGGLSQTQKSIFQPKTFDELDMIGTVEDHWIYNFVDEKNITPTIDFDRAGGEELLERMLDTQRCYWEDTDFGPLRLGQPIDSCFEWQHDQDGFQSLMVKSPYPVYSMGGTLCAFNDDAYTIHLLKLPFKGLILKELLDVPAISFLYVDKARETLEKNMPLAPNPYSFKEETTMANEPVPMLYFTESTILKSMHFQLSKLFNLVGSSFTSEDKPITVAHAQLSFKYGNEVVPFNTTNSFFYHKKDNCIIRSPRNIEFEKKEAEKLKKFGLIPVVESSFADGISYNDGQFTSSFCFDDEDNNKQMMIDFIMNHLNSNFQECAIQYDPETPFHIVNTDDQSWYANIDENQQGWFDFDLGVQIDGQKINLLGALTNLLRQHPNILNDVKRDTNESGEVKRVLAPLGDGRHVAIPLHRFEHILTALHDLYVNPNISEDGVLQISKQSASQVDALFSQFEDVQWNDPQRLRELGEKMNNFKGIQEVDIPKGLNASLREYQKEGLDWLQFLREFEFGGILADDMGLGKTIQTLCHLLVEKESGRLTKPCLIVAPTSLMSNWRMEIEKFAPDLRVLLFHGADREKELDQFNDYDVILTTYSLLWRDAEEIFLKGDFYYLILDEAQAIKNTKAKLTHLIVRIKANHRLCLTGTPLENHLGELWSLFNFLMPGFLGKQTDFQKIFRNPIERDKDRDRQVLLNQRVKPFILRRLKNEVAKELPLKTEIICPIEIEGDQRDLYETLRVSMHQKVQQAIESNGLSKSHMVILEALLRLRQVCCDPRLLKNLAFAERVVHNAKRSLLLDMLPGMIADGRRILLFSQFTSVLDFIKDDLREVGIEFTELRGDTKDRLKPVQDFQAGKIPLFLISLKAGGVGLNLTAADTVIHYDPWWNPAVENQATDRAYRIGQDKPVFVYKFITQGTVEEKILSLQNQKRALSDGILGEDTAMVSGLKTEDLTSLFEPLQL